MKTFLLILLAALLSTGIFAQQDQVSLEKANQFEKMVQPYPGVFSTRETKWVQDSSYYYFGDPQNDDGWVLKNRYMVTQRNSAGNVTNSLFHFYDEASGDWTKAIKVANTFFQNNNGHTHLESPWNSDTQTWNDTSTFYGFNEDDIQTLLIYKTWDFSNNHFTNGYKRVYNMVADSSYYEFRSYNLNMNSNLWELSFHEKRYFDEENKDTLVLKQSWSSNSNTWNNLSKIYYQYENGQIVSATGIVWDNYLNQWVNQTYNQYTYNANEDMETMFIQIWNSDSAHWENSQNTNYYFNDSGKTDSVIRAVWNSDQELWKNFSREVTSYETDGSISIQQYWDSDTQQWENHSRTTSVNNEQGLMTAYTYQNWNSETENWKNNLKYDLFWSEIEVHGIDEEVANRITIYPDPASETITIMMPGSLSNNMLSIYSLSGKLIKSVVINSGLSTIDISVIPSGLYFASFRTNHGIITKRFVKR